jgi:hypothetical protein
MSCEWIRTEQLRARMNEEKTEYVTGWKDDVGEEMRHLRERKWKCLALDRKWNKLKRSLMTLCRVGFVPGQYCPTILSEYH